MAVDHAAPDPAQPAVPSAPPPRPELHPIEAAARERAILLRLVRAGFFILIITVAILNSAQTAHTLNISWWVPIVIALILVAVAFLVDLSTPNKKISAISGVFLGVLAGMLATLALSAVMDLLLQASMDDPQTLRQIQPIVNTLKVMLGITLCYLGITTVLQTQDDFRLVIPYVEFAKQIRGPKPLILDSSALVDARIADLAQTGIIQAAVLVPRFVVGELQLLADSTDRLRRSKGRRGLDVITRLQRLPGIDISIDETIVAGKGVDQMLIELARRLPGTIVTTDSGLARVAAIQGVSVLNLHDVANAVRPALIPGEQITLQLIKPGEQPGQGVGYLDDGTMVVAEDGGDRVGRSVTLTVTSTLQTSAGRLIFGRVVPEPAPEGRPAPPPASEPAPPSQPQATSTAGAERQGPFPPAPPRRANPARNPRR